MNILDENVGDDQWRFLRGWRIPARKIGRDIGYKGLPDSSIITLLHEIGRATFFTGDPDFYRRELRHPSYCLVCVLVDPAETASFIRRVLRHAEFNTRAKRMGKVIMASHRGIRVWRLHAEVEQAIGWTT